MKIKIRTNILLHFLFVVLILSAAFLGVQYYFSEKIATEAVDKTFHQTAHTAALTLQQKDLLAKEVLYQVESHPSLSQKPSDDTAKVIVHLFIHILERYQNMYAMYLGYGNGDFFEVVNMVSSKTIKQRFKAPAGTRWTIIHIYTLPNGKRVREFIFMNRSLQTIKSRREPSSYVVTVRPWYQDAIRASGAVRSDPYLFSNLGEKGITYAKRLEGSKTVLALDFTLDNLQKVLKDLPFAKEGVISFFGRNGSLIASSDPTEEGAQQVFTSIIKYADIDSIHKVTIENKTYFAMIVPLSVELGENTYVGVSVDYATMIAPYRKQIYYAFGIALILLLLFIPLTLLLTHYIVKPVKALMAENELIRQRKFEAVKPIESNIVEFIALSNSQIEMSKSIQNYQKQLETLLDSFIKLIADAIDAKSAYTGTHCKKVPIIATMLAEAASTSQKTPLQNFVFVTEEQKRAFERAAWLHDCGKITTPEYVVDKATKLETIYNRIHEIRTRFEVLWRDIEIEYYERLLYGESEARLKTWKEKEQKRLKEEFALVAQCNIGTEFMEEEKIEQLKNIANRTWVRHFDDRLGLAEEELARYNTTKPLPLPTVERLLDDKPYHLIERVDFDEESYKRERFTLPVPQYLYNRGELYNLCVQKGTLTDEERFKINEHVIMTIKMLERLPFPENMKAIPTVAGEHHETLDGRGYPRSLTEHDLSIPSRILAIADIFEALTASDRPYKKAKTLSEALTIMKKMKEERHIDADLFELFIASGVYKTYAKAYLKPEQIDAVDEEALLK